MANQKDLARGLLKRATEDEAAARAMLPIKSVTNRVVGFHAQQAVAKSIKAVLAARGVDFPYTHDIDALTRICKKSGIFPPEELDEAARLTPYAGPLRYDDEVPVKVDRETALRWASVTIAWARAQVTGE